MSLEAPVHNKSRTVAVETLISGRSSILYDNEYVDVLESGCLKSAKNVILSLKYPPHLIRSLVEGSLVLQTTADVGH